MLGRIIQQFVSEKAHVQIVLTLKDGVILPVQVNRSFRPDELPKLLHQ
jgi:hypothetical protein